LQKEGRQDSGEGDEETRKEGRARRETLGRKSREGGRNEEGGIKCCIEQRGSVEKGKE
jgi:hypothetical protein